MPKSGELQILVWKRLESPETEAESIKAKAGGPETPRAFANSSLGQPFDDELETSVEVATLMNRREAAC